MTGEIQNRPPIKLFNASDYSLNEVTRIKGTKTSIFRGNKYNQSGFLLKDFNISNIESTKINPPYEVV